MPGKAKDDVTSTDHTPNGVHSLVAMPATPPSIESAGQDSPNAMAIPDGGFLFPDSPQDADLMHVEHGAMPANPEIWPWPGHGGAPAEVDPGEFCADPATCFPNGIHPSWVGVACVHTGGQTHWLVGRS